MQKEVEMNDYNYIVLGNSPKSFIDWKEQVTKEYMPYYSIHMWKNYKKEGMIKARVTDSDSCRGWAGDANQEEHKGASKVFLT